MIPIMLSTEEYRYGLISTLQSGAASSLNMATKVDLQRIVGPCIQKPSCSRLFPKASYAPTRDPPWLGLLLLLSRCSETSRMMQCASDTDSMHY